MLRLVFTLALLIAGPAAAQTTGQIRGKVIDRSSKQPLPGANVRLLGTAIGATSNLDGIYTLVNVPENVYTLQVDFIGFNSFVETDVRVVRDRTTTVREIQMTESAIEGDEVTVVAGAFQQNKQAPVSNYNYSREEIRRSPGATGDLFRAIETLPGVSSSGYEFSAFSVRGGSPRDNIVLIDNIPFSKVSHFDGGTEEQEAQGGRFSIFTPGLIESANFQAGGFGARYGGKNASLVDLTIKEGNRENAIVDGTYDVIGWEINYDGPSRVHKNTGVILSARHQDFQRILDWTGQGDLGHPRYTDVILKTTTDVNADHKISLLGIYAWDGFNRTLSHVFESDNLYGNDVGKVRETKVLAGINWRYLTGPKSFLQTSAYFSRIHNPLHFGRAYTDTIDGVVPTRDNIRIRPDIYNEDARETQFGIKSEFTALLSPILTFRTGVEVNRFVLDYTFTQNGLDTTFVFDQNDYRPDPNRYFLVRDPLNTNSSVETTRHTYAGYGELSYTLGNYVTFNPGVRVEYNTFNKNNTVAPRLSVSYQLSERTTLNGAAGLYYQSPELETIGQDIGNAKLKNQKATHLIAGVTHYIGDNWKLTVEGYSKAFDDLIVRPDRTSNRRTNDGDGWARGIDVGLVKRFVNKWYGQVNYSRMASKRNDHGGEGEYNSDFSQPNIFNLLIGYQFNKEWSIATKWKYATGRPTDSYIVHADVLNDPTQVRYSKEIVDNNGRRLDTFHTWNVRVDYRKQFRKFAIVSFVDVLNVYGHLNVNEEFFQYQDGKIDKRGFRIAPTMGIKVEI